MSHLELTSHNHDFRLYHRVFSLLPVSHRCYTHSHSVWFTKFIYKISLTFSNFLNWKFSYWLQRQDKSQGGCISPGRLKLIRCVKLTGCTLIVVVVVSTVLLFSSVINIQFARLTGLKRKNSLKEKINFSLLSRI